MSRRRFEKLDPERQTRLFKSAAEEFAAQGFDGASLNRILEKSGMSKSSLYYYFDDKADLFTTLIERTLGILFREIGGLDPDALTAEDFWTTFERLYERSVAVVGRNAWFVQFGGMFYRLRDAPKGAAATGRVFQAARSWIARILERGQALGVVRTDIPQSLLVDSTMSLLESLDRWVVAHWSDLGEEEKRAMPQLHVGLFRSLLAAEATETP